MQIIDGKALADSVLTEAKNRIINDSLSPRLDIILIGNNIASKVYVSKKIEAAQSIGVEVKVHEFDDLSEDALIDLIKKLNDDILVNAIIVQLPIPNFDPTNAISHISPRKDVDGLNPFSLGKLWQGSGYSLVPATALAVLSSIEHVARSNNMSLEEYLRGKNALIINRSVIIGKPVAALLLNNNATVTIAHSKTQDLNTLLKQADIVISGTGQAGFITGDKIKQDAVIIDTGFNKNDEGMWGDVDNDSVASKASWVSPVPGGIGPLGVAMLISNTVEAASIQITL